MNTRISIEPGLQDTYQVFNLNAKKINDNINIKIIIDGDQYVENDTPQIMHAGDSNFKHFEGINNISSNDWDLSNYGEKFKSLLVRYFSNHTKDIDDSRGYDIYENESAYKNYKNQFTVIFEDKANDSIHINGQYLGYMQNPISANEKKCISKLLGEVNGIDNNYIFVNTNIIHFSKYYNIYKSSDISVPVLQPVLYTKEDLEKLNMTINKGNAYINSLSTFTSWNDGTGERDKRRENRYECDPETGDFSIKNSNSIKSFGHNAKVDWSYSQFKQHSTGKHFVTELSEVSEEYYDSYFPRGFMFFTLSKEKGTFGINSNNYKSGQSFDRTVPYIWQQWFKRLNNKYYYYLDQYGHADGDSDTILAGLYYRGDKEDNVHLLNCWFTLYANNKDGRIVTQQIAYNDKYTGMRPNYIGTCIASIFANIYHYVQDSDISISQIVDVVYLNEHNTTYTKDMVYMASIEKHSIEDPSELLIFKGTMKYGGKDGYVELVKKNAGATNDSQYSGDNNVKAVINSCVKNVPLQYKLTYKEPNTDLINSNNDLFILKTIDNPQGTRLYGKLNTNRLYQLDYDIDGKLTVDFLNKSFKIKYLQSIKLDEKTRTISGEFNKKFQEDNNPDISSTWDIDNGLILSNYKYLNSPSRYYSIITTYGDDIQFADYDKQETLLPFAKFVV